MCSIGVEESVVRKVSDGWEKEEEEDENVDGRGGGGDLVGVRGANASLEISAPRRLVSRPSPIGRREGGRGGGLIAPFPAAAAESQWQIRLPFWTTERFSQREVRSLSRMMNVQSAAMMRRLRNLYVRTVKP